MVRTTFVRTKSASRSFSVGKNAVGIDHRSGFKVPYTKLKFEPGTNWLVTREESDGEYSLVNHPQNYYPEKRAERIALRWAFPDVVVSLGTVVSADDLGLPAGVSVSGMQIVYPDGNVQGGLNFNFKENSQYYVIVFQGI